jgi:hypothetical protein
VGVQIRWDRGGTKPASECTFFYRKGHENHELGTGFFFFFLHKRTTTAFKRAEFVINSICFIKIIVCWCDIIVLNVHLPTEDKTNAMKDSFHLEPECVFDKYPKSHMKLFGGKFQC